MNRKLVILALLIALVVLGAHLVTAQSATPAVSPDLQTNTDLVRQYVAVLNSHDLSGLDAILSANYVEHDPFVPEDPPAGIDAFKQVAGGILAGFPDVKITIELMVANGDLVATRHSVVATNTGSFNGIPATGKTVTWTENHIFRIADGKIVEHWAELNALGILTQLGAIPGAQ